MRIAIIGSGGAGITAAWLLDGRHDVTLFERRAILGGHAHSVTIELDGRRYVADDGFGWFSDGMYPCYTRLLAKVGVATRDVMMSLSFTRRGAGRTVLLPPSTVRGWIRTIANPATVGKLLKLHRAVRAATPVVEGGHHQLPWGEFLERQDFDRDFCRDFLTPLVAGVWGCPYERVQDVSAYTLMKYVVFHRPTEGALHRWRVIRDGAASYVGTVAATLRTATIRAATGIARIARAGAGWRVHDQRGGAHQFDHVLLATGAPDAAAMLRDSPGLGKVRHVLADFEYYRVRLATHSDRSFMPPDRADWQVANVLTGEGHARLSIWGQQHTGGEVFTSYLGDDEPERCHHVSTFNLPLMTPAHYRAQAALGRIQGVDRLHFAGDWTRDIGCHEDAVVSAIDACRAIDPAASRLAELQPGTVVADVAQVAERERASA